MNLDWLNIGTKLLDKVIPDASQRDEAKIKLLELAQTGQFHELDQQLTRDLAQIDLNKEEAKSESLFKSGWRPFVGWVCGFALAYEFLIRVLLGYVLGNWLHWMEPPHLDMGDLLTLLGGLLGLGTLRTAEKFKGVHK